MPITGQDLRSERRAADITVTEIAARMGLSRWTVHVMEKSAVLTVERVSQYRAALDAAKLAAKEKVA